MNESIQCTLWELYFQVEFVCLCIATIAWAIILAGGFTAHAHMGQNNDLWSAMS